MKKIKFAALIMSLFVAINVCSQPIKFDKSKLEAVQVYLSVEKLMGKDVVKVIKDSTVKRSDAPTYCELKGIDFKNGTIEVKVRSRLLPDASSSARGFIGIVFRINDTNSKFEGIYIRPTNGRSNNQVRRNHFIQYISYPDFDFERFRKEAPEQYESYADMTLNTWIKLKIVVKDDKAKLFINDHQQPSLIVNDLKHGPVASGNIGLWVDMGTEGYFADLKISK
ncbi:MAG: hypothetical protein ABIR66_11960 [Saprospiraceae bacterium]